MTPPDIAALRKSLGLSQAEFASRYWLSRRVVEEWEQGRRVPQGAALVLLQLIAHDPEWVASTLTFLAAR